MENKKFKKNNKKERWIIFAYGLIPILKYIILGVSFENYFFIEIFLYILIGFFIYKFTTKTIAEIKDGILLIYSGIGLKDPSKISVSNINKIERLSKNLLKITYNQKEEMSMEAYPNVITQIEKYFR